MVGNDRLQRCGNEEILLGKAEQLTLGMVVGRIQNLGQNFRIGVLLHCLQISTLREQVHVEHRGGLCLPQTQNVDSLTVGTGNHDIIRNRLDFLVVIMNDVTLAVLPGFLDVTAETDSARLIGSGNEHNITAGQPVVRQLDLLTVDKLLLEQTVFIQQRETGCGIVECGSRVHIACGKTTETAVAKTRIRFAFVNGIERKAEFRQNITVDFCETKIAEVILQRTADEEFHAHIVQGLAGLALDFFFIFRALLGQNVLDAHHNGAIDLIFIGFCHGNAEIAGKLGCKCFPDGFFGEFLIHG